MIVCSEKALDSLQAYMEEENQPYFLWDGVVDPRNLAFAKAFVAFADDLDFWAGHRKLGFDGIPHFELVRSSNLSLREKWGLIKEAVRKYDCAHRPLFFDALKTYVDTTRRTYSTPGHHKGEFFKWHPLGNELYNWFGPAIFTSDVSSSDSPMGDPLIHDGPTALAEARAAKHFNSDRTFFTTNGTTGANIGLCQALLTKDDMVLFDRNNHKSLYIGAFSQAGANPVFIEAERNEYGFICGMIDEALSEVKIRAQLAAIDPKRAHLEKPFRLAILQHCTYDGYIYNCRLLIDRIGHLCEYVLFDSAWLGYEHCLPISDDYSPLRMPLKKGDPGILVTQSVHKQMAGFSQCSQIHKRDKHIEKEAYYCPDRMVTYGLMLHASTSPFYPFISAMDVNSMIHERSIGRYLWKGALRTAEVGRKAIKRKCNYFRTIEQSDEVGSQSFPALLDPTKLTIFTKDEKGKYPIPAHIVYAYLIQKGFIPEKCDLYTILLTLTPGDTEGAIDALVDALVDFEEAYERDVLLKNVLPTFYKEACKSYEALTLKELCYKLASVYETYTIAEKGRALFSRSTFPQVAMNSMEAREALVKGKVKFLLLDEAVGQIALEGAVAYPPGIVIVNAGERWSKEAVAYFKGLVAASNEIKGLNFEMQGLYWQEKKGIKYLTVPTLSL